MNKNQHLEEQGNQHMYQILEQQNEIEQLGDQVNHHEIQIERTNSTVRTQVNTYRRENEQLTAELRDEDTEIQFMKAEADEFYICIEVFTLIRIMHSNLSFYLLRIISI